MDAIKYVASLVLALIVISIVVGVLYMLSGSWANETNQSAQQNSGLLDCVQEEGNSYAYCKNQYSETGYSGEKIIDRTEAVAT